jgi:hypothetical protein
MKTFKQYLQESKQTYTFRIKLANPISDENMDRIERHLAKYDVASVSAPKKLMLQSTPYDFPQLRGYEIHVIEFVTNLPASAYQIQTEIQSLLGLSDGFMKVRSDKEPLEQQEQQSLGGAAEVAESVLADADYKDAEKVDGSDYFGDKYNTKFVQELLKLRKEKEKNNE